MPDERHVRVAAGKIYESGLGHGDGDGALGHQRQPLRQFLALVVDGSGKARICISARARSAASKIYARLAGSDDWVLVYSYR